MENWAPIQGYEGIYEISDCGNVRRVAYFDNASKCHHKLLANMKQQLNSAGYLRIKLMKDGNEKIFLVHRIVAITFIPNPHNYPQVNHKNCNKQDNYVSNLEWCSRSQNQNHAHANGLRNMKNRKGSKPVGQYSLDGVLLQIYPSTREAVRQNPTFNQANIWKCCSGKTNTQKGFIWRYIDSE